ncbi:hypothetical protein BDM02DRAFT_3132464 [Thelephora ganbajun]|uniref:Uncharacterized protein n=1 Tax=Thelephora ganbajun TaxID=370292 RepID=A0ACB6Z190_THEGA|nr:hypothetical protein BDM02DRAFT_3132464 [Thelephora ganbajun]
MATRMTKVAGHHRTESESTSGSSKGKDGEGDGEGDGGEGDDDGEGDGDDDGDDDGEGDDDSDDDGDGDDDSEGEGGDGDGDGVGGDDSEMSWLGSHPGFPGRRARFSWPTRMSGKDVLDRFTNLDFREGAVAPARRVLMGMASRKSRKDFSSSLDVHDMIMVTLEIEAFFNRELKHVPGLLALLLESREISQRQQPAALLRVARLHATATRTTKVAGHHRTESESTSGSSKGKDSEGDGEGDGGEGDDDGEGEGDDDGDDDGDSDDNSNDNSEGEGGDGDGDGVGGDDGE